MDLLSGLSFRQLEGAVQASAARHQTITNNLANGNTPYFKRSDVEFESILREKMNNSTMIGNRTDSRHFYIGPSQQVPEFRVVQDQTTVTSNDGNNVDVELEATKQVDNQLRYYSYISQINHEINMKRTAIDARR